MGLPDDFATFLLDGGVLDAHELQDEDLSARGNDSALALELWVVLTHQAIVGSQRLEGV